MKEFDLLSIYPSLKKRYVSKNTRKIENRICDFYIICTGTSNTHVSAILDSVKKKVSKTLKEKPSHTEGQENAEWI